MSRCLYFGCWGAAGHYLVGPGGCDPGLPREQRYRLSRLLDGQFAPKRVKGGPIVWGDNLDWANRNAGECQQGKFLRHTLEGFTLIQWWDRNQGDTRPGCSSTVLLEGEHTSAEMLAALAEYFPHVLANLKRAGVELVDVTPEVIR